MKQYMEGVEMSPAHVGKKLKNLAMKGSREIILELYVGSSEKLFFVLMKDPGICFC